MFLPQMFRGRQYSGNSFWEAMLGGVRSSQSKTGIIITPETALGLSAVRACVTLLAESVAQLPCELYRRDKNGGRQRATDHPVYDLIHSQPNRKDTSFEYFEQQQGLLGLEGNCYSIIERDGKGYPKELIPINPKKVIVLKGPDGMPYYELPEVGEILPMRMMHHVKVFSLDGYIGSSPIQTNADVLGLNLAVEEHAAATFRRGTTMSGVIERPKEAATIKSQDAIDRLLAKWTERHSGIHNMFSVALLQEGMSYKQLSQDNEKAQLLQSRQWGVEEVCRLYKIPPHMVQMLAKATNNNIEHQGLQFVMYTLLAWLKRHEGALQRDLLLPSERRDLYIEFNVSGLLRGDQKSRYESYALGRQWGWLTSAEGKLDSQSQQLTSLQNSLTTMNTELGKKADTSAVSSLTGRVSQVENTITSQSQSITSLTSTINTIRTQGANPWVDGTFESYSDGQVLGGSGTAVVVASQKFTGGKSLKLRRDENNSGNSDKQLGTWQSVREDAKFRFEFWAMMPADQAPSSGWTTLVGIQSQNAAGQNAWQAAVTVSEASLGARDKWVKFTGIASNNGAGRTRAVVWISTRGATGNGTPGYSLYIDDLVITDVTDAKAAQDASDATASAVSGLTARVTDAEGKITAQAQQQTALATKVDNANSRVDNMAKTLSDSQSTQASLNTSLQSQIDAQAAANIKNQTTLDNTIKSVASITSTQQTHATALEALATQQTTLTSSVGDLSASVQNTAKTVADVNGTVSSLWSMKVETVNGKNVGAGITLGSNGETSDMILYADRFSLFNRNNATAVPVMIAEGNELYIDTARIKNSSLTSTKIADGSITNAKIGNEIRSNNFVDGSQGWRIAKDGSSQFNNVIVRGRVEANSGVFRGTVQADAFIGDIAVAKGYDSLTFRRNQTVQRNGAYQNRGYSMTVVLACTLVCQTYGTGSGLGYTSDITFNIGGQEVTRRIFVDAGNITAGTTAFELRFAARLDADYNNVGFFIKATGRNAAIDYTCTVENITATAFRTDSSSFS